MNRKKWKVLRKAMKARGEEQFHLRGVSPEFKKAFKEACEVDGRSMSSVFRSMVINFVKETLVEPAESVGEEQH